jgi:hypothetical protein
MYHYRQMLLTAGLDCLVEVVEDAATCQQNLQQVLPAALWLL